MCPEFARPEHARSRMAPRDGTGTACDAGSAVAVPFHQIVVVDGVGDSYGEFVRAAQHGSIGLHFCIDGGSALRLARTFRADAWLIAMDLPDMASFDLIGRLSPLVRQSNVDPLRSGARISLDRVDDIARSAIFVVADAYRMDEERRALASGVAGYVVRPVTLASVSLNTASLRIAARDAAPVGGSLRPLSFPDGVVPCSERSE